MKFSVILPTYNRAKFIEGAINSVLNQDYLNWELIIIDNFSTDNTQTLVEKFNDKRIIYVKYKNYGIIAKARNYGIKLSNGNYLAFLDSDDWWYPNKLTTMADLIKEHPYDCLYHNMHMKYNNSYFKKKMKYTRKLFNPYLDLVNFGPAFPTSSVVIKKDLFFKINLFNESTNYLAWEDFDAWLRFAKKLNSFFFIKKFLGCAHIGDHNFSTDSIKKKNLFLFKKKYLNNKKLSELPYWCNYAFMRIFSAERKYKTSLKFSGFLINNTSIKNLPKVLLFYVKNIIFLNLKKY
tara:strand:+ start:348 stop:1223 length:876 start_codon:yes stop_codon:yes gene_type:complete